MELNGVKQLRRTRVLPCLRERDEMLVAVQFPQYLVVAGDGSVQIVDLTPVSERRSQIGERLVIPSRRRTDVRPSVTEYRDFTAHDSARSMKHARLIGRDIYS